MTCQHYILLLTSGQLKSASPGMRISAIAHRTICRYCRTFTRNDARLDAMLKEVRENHLDPDQS